MTVSSADPIAWTWWKNRPGYAPVEYLDRLERRNQRQNMLLWTLAALLVAAMGFSISTSGQSVTTTATYLNDPAVTSYNGPIAFDRSPTGHSVCSAWSSGAVCVTVTRFAYQPESCSANLCTPSRTTSQWRSVWATPDVVDMSITNTGSKPFQLVFDKSDTFLTYQAVIEDSPPQEFLQALPRVTSVSTSTSGQCGHRLSAVFLLRAHRRASICATFPLAVWAWGPRGPAFVVDRPTWEELEVAGFAMWDRPENFTTMYTPPSILPAPLGAFGVPGFMFDVTGPQQTGFYSYQYQQVLGSSTGKVIVGPTRPGIEGSPEGEAPHSGVVLLMIRQRSLDGRLLQSQVTDAYIDVGYACTSTGCSVARLSPDWSFSVTHIATCQGRLRFTCVPFDLTTASRVFDVAYNVTFWGSAEPHGAVGGITDTSNWFE